MIDLSKCDVYLIADEAGIATVDDAPDQVKNELEESTLLILKCMAKRWLMWKRSIPSYSTPEM